MAKPRSGEYYTRTSMVYKELKETTNPCTFSSLKAILKTRGVRIKYGYKEEVD